MSFISIANANLSIFGSCVFYDISGKGGNSKFFAVARSKSLICYRWIECLFEVNVTCNQAELSRIMSVEPFSIDNKINWFEFPEYDLLATHWSKSIRRSYKASIDAGAVQSIRVESLVE